MIKRFTSQWYRKESLGDMLPRKGLQGKLLQFSLLFALGLLCFSIVSYRIDRAPDIHLDEMFYYKASLNLATVGEYTWNDRDPILVHPPLYFLIQAAFLSVVGQADVFEPFQGIYSARLLNAVVGGLTIILLFRFAERLGGLRVALLTSSLFLFDPFVVRINRRSMLETMGEFWIVLGLYLFWRDRDRLKWPQMILIGVVFGCALLTKEMMIFGLGTLPLFVLLTKRWQDMKKVAVICCVSLATWSLFPLWAWTNSYGPAFFENKFYNTLRLLGVIRTTGWNKEEGVSFTGAVSKNIEQYGSSYFLILLGGLLVVVIWWIWRDEKGRFVVAWALTQYMFGVYIALFGTVHGYYYYYLLVPLMLMISFAIVRFADSLIGHPRRRQALLVVGLLFVTIQSFNVYRWVKLFAIEDDRALYELTEYIYETVPTGTTINSMFHQNSKLLPSMLPDYDVVGMRNIDRIQEEKVEYITLSSRNLWSLDGLITPAYYEWVVTHGELIYSTYGNTFENVALYRMPIEEWGQRDTDKPQIASQDDSEDDR